MADIRVQDKGTEATSKEGLPNSISNFTSYDRSYRGQVQNSPLLMYTVSDPANPIYFWVNPNEAQWRIATRTSIEQINGGAVHHEWRSVGIGEQPSQKFDQPVVNFSFQSGLILPNGTVDLPGSQVDTNRSIFASLKGETQVTESSERTKARMPQGLGNFYDFLEILNRKTDFRGAPNYVIINYSSPVFPEIQLQGFFSAEGVQWTETAENPNMVTGWGASFIVFRSDPPLYDAGAFHRKYIGVMPF